MRLSEAIDCFLTVRRALARSPHTLANYRRALEMLVAHCGDLEVADVTPLHLDALFADLQPRYAASSMRTHWMISKAFWNWALSRRLADTGCRIGAACGLRVGDIDMGTCTAVVREKGDRETRVDFTPSTRKALSAWIRAHPRCAHDCVFIS